MAPNKAYFYVQWREANMELLEKESYNLGRLQFWDGYNLGRLHFWDGYNSGRLQIGERYI